MQLTELLKDYKIQKSSKTERGELLKEFTDLINQERGKLPKLTISRMAYLLQGLTVQNMYAFLSMCKDRKLRNNNCSAFFWWSLKP